MHVCPNCGNELPIIGGGAFCTNCGARLSTETSDRSHDDTVTLPAVSVAGGAGTGDPYAEFFRPAPGEPNPHAMTQVIPAVAPEPEYDPVPLPPRVSRSVLTSVGVAVVAVAVIAVSVITLAGGKKAPAAQPPPGQTEIITPTSTDSSAALGNGEPTAPSETAPTSTSETPTPSTSTAPPPSPITGAGSGRCVDIPGGNPVDGAQVVLFSCNNTAAQAWTYTGGTVQAMGKCLDVRGAASEDRTPIQIAACNGSPAQQWRYNPQTGELQALGKCLDAFGGGTGDHTPLILYTCHQADNQKWRVAP
ncbi:MAG: ricin-type beta-trefoil lectin domain protein [Catenulispora sp.]